MLSFLGALMISAPLFFIGRINIKTWKGFFTAIITLFYISYIFLIIDLDVYIFLYLPVFFALLIVFWHRYSQTHTYDNILVARVITYSMSSIFMWILMSITTTPDDYYWYHILSWKELIGCGIYFTILMTYYGYITWTTWEWLSSFIFLIILDIYLIFIYYCDNGIYFTGDIDITFHLFLVISTILWGLMLFRSIWCNIKKYS